jgi:hypothetical protein
MNAVNHEDHPPIRELPVNIAELEKQVILMEDIQEIENLQRRYGYYFDTCNFQAIVDLFSDSADSADLESFGLFRGKEGIRRLYWNDIGRGGRPRDPSESWISTVVIQIGGVVNLDPRGVAARGRWQTWLAETFLYGGVPRQYWVHGYYENEYVKERGKWFFKKLFWNVTFLLCLRPVGSHSHWWASCLWPTLMDHPLPFTRIHQAISFRITTITLLLVSNGSHWRQGQEVPRESKSAISEREVKNESGRTGKKCDPHGGYSGDRKPSKNICLLF